MTTKKRVFGQFVPLQIAERLIDSWSPKVIAEVNDSYIKVAKLQGELVRHSHHEDEMFLVLKGRLIIQLDDRDIVLEQGQSVVIPAGTQHNPKAEETCLVMLIESKTTLHTGDVRHEKSKSIEEQLAN